MAMLPKQSVKNSRLPLVCMSVYVCVCQDELPFEAIQRCLEEGAGGANPPDFRDMFADFASRCVSWDFATLGHKFRFAIS